MSWLSSFLAKAPSFSSWQKVGIYPHQGICIPLFSLKSTSSEGIGDFYDAFFCIDWLHSLPMDVLQLLPLNDTGEDSSPYNAQSSCSLDPVYLRLTALPGIEPKKNPWKELLEPLFHLNQQKNLYQPQVRQKKLLFLRKYFEIFFSERAKEEAYLSFQQKHPWLIEYALYKALKHQFYQKPWFEWPSPYHDPKEPKIFTWLQKFSKEIHFYTFLQYLCFSQLSQLRQYAQEKKVFLMGDIPFLVSKDSADVWFHRQVFQLEELAGSPPDLFSAQGQCWGQPIFNWDYLEKSHYFWWERRLQVASQFYDIYRLDHAVGFFRVWSVPEKGTLKQGHFISNNPYLWPFEGKKRLNTLLSLSSMLPMAEDLGTIPPEVEPTLKELGICSTKVVRWTKRWEEDGSYFSPEEYPPCSVTYLSNHDSQTLKQWWLTFPEEAKRLCFAWDISYEPTLSPSTRKELLQKAHHTASLFHMNLLPEYFALYPELLFSPEDRINLPGTISPKNWSYRMRPTWEEVLSHKKLAKSMQEIIHPKKKENL